MTTDDAPLAPALQDMRILVVDDYEPNATLLRLLLTKWGFHRVTCLTDSARVAGHCEADPPDLVLLDLNMPHPDGFAILRSLRHLIQGKVPMPVLVLTAETSSALKRQALAGGARDFLSKPFDADEVRLRVGNLLQLRSLQLAQHRTALDLEERVRDRTKELEEARLDVLSRLARAGEFRDDETGEHTRRVARTARLLSLHAGFDDGLASGLEIAAPLHDIGKIGVPDAILLKPGRLTDAERETMQRHAEIGAEMLDGGASELLCLARDIALSHHERWDGTGYPAGAAGEEIPLGGRIVALADVFDALTHERPYKRAWSTVEAVAEISSQAGRQFDPRLVRVFCELDHEALV